jgi:TP901 family phage tail tape measure protein
MAEEKKVVVKVIGDTSDLTKKLNALERKLKDFTSTLNKVDDEGFDKVIKDSDKLNEAINKVDKTVDNLKEDINEIDDNKALNNVAKAGEKAKETFDNLGKELKATQEEMKEVGENTGKITTKLEGVNEEAKEGVNTFNRLKESTSDVAKNLKDGFNSAGQSINNTTTKATKGMSGLVNTTANVATALGSNKELLSRWKNAWGNAGKAIEKSKNLTNAMDKSIDKATDSISKGTKVIDENSEAYKKYTKNISQAKKANEEIAESVENTGKETTTFGKKIEELFGKLKKFASTKFKDIFGNLFDAFKKFKDGDISGAFTSLKSAVGGLKTGFTGAVAGAIALGAGLKKLYDLGKQRFFTGLQDMKNMFQPLINLTKRAGYEIKTAFENLTGMRIDLSSFIETVVNFEDSIVRVGAIAGATDEQFDKLSNVAREFGATTRFSASQASDAMQNLAMAGWSVEEMIDGLGSTLNLAIIGEMSLADASTFVSDGLASLGMSAKQTSDFVDMLSATATNSNTSVSQLQGAFTNVAPIAGTLGVTMSDLSVALGLMANQGVKAEKSATSLKNLLTNMSSPTEAQAKAIAKYGLEEAQTLITNGKLVEGIKEMKKQLSGLTAKQKTATITTIAGKYALSGVSALMNSSTSDINELQFAVDSSTKSSKLYAQTLGLVDEEGRMCANSLEELKDKNKEGYKQWQKFNEVMNETADTMTFVGGTTTDLGAIVQKLGEDHKVSAKNVEDILNVFDKLRDGSDKSAKVMKNYGIQLAYTEEGSLNFGQTLKNVGKVWDGLGKQQKKTLLAQLGYKGSLEEMDELFSNNGSNIEDLVDKYERAKGVSEHMAKTFDSTLKGSIFNLSSAIEERLLQVFDKFKDGVKSVTNTLKTFFDIWNGLDESGKGSGLGDALAFLADKAKDWGTAIKNGIVNAIKGLDGFINGGAFDSLLDIGTSIIQGICSGISESKNNGSLDSAIDGFIKKICAWIEKNSDAIVTAGQDIIDALKGGIRKNSTRINSAMEDIYDIIDTFVRGKESVIRELGLATADAFIGGFLSGAWHTITDTIWSAWSHIVGGDDEGKSGSYNAENKNFGAGSSGGHDFVYTPQAVIDENNTGQTQKIAIKYADSTIDAFKKRVSERLNNDEITISQSNLITMALDRGEEAKKNADLTTQAYINEIQGRLAEGQISESSYNKLLSGFKQTSKAKENANETTKSYIDQLEVGLASGTIDPSTIGAVLSVLSESESVNTEGNKIAQNYMDALREQLTTGQITPEEFRTLALSGDFMKDAKEYASTNKIKSDDVIDAQSFSNVQEVNDLMDALDELEVKYDDMSITVTKACGNMANATRTQFVNVRNIIYNQMIRCHNIVRNQFVNMALIVENQCFNMRKDVAERFISMRKVMAIQSYEGRREVVSKFMSIAKVVNTQAWKARDNATRAFISMRKVIATQMSEAYQTVTKYMDKIRTATNKSFSMSLDVNRKVTTSYVVDRASHGIQQGMMNRMSANMGMVGSPSTQAVGGSSSGNLAMTGGGAVYEFSIPVVVDGKQIALASASYTEAELAKRSKRRNRKRGE